MIKIENILHVGVLILSLGIVFLSISTFSSNKIKRLIMISLGVICLYVYNHWITRKIIILKKQVNQIRKTELMEGDENVNEEIK